MSTFKGHCNCGKFAFEAPSPKGTAACFCKCCTRGGGSLCSLNAVIPAKNGLTFTSEAKEEQLNVYLDKNTSSGKPMQRKFCGTCGSPLLSVPQDSEIAYFKYSLLEDPESYLASKGPDMMIFTKRAPQWSKPGGAEDATKNGLQFPKKEETQYS